MLKLAVQPSVTCKEKSTRKCNYLSTFLIAATVFIFINCLLVNQIGLERSPSSIDLSTSPKELNVIGKVASWWLTKAYFATPRPPDVVILGSSQLGALDCADAHVYHRIVDFTGDHRSLVIEQDLKALIGGNWRVLVAGLPGMLISDQFLIARALFSKQYKPQVVAVTFSPRDFIDDTCPGTTQTESFAFFAKYIDLKNTADIFRVQPTLTSSYLISKLPLRALSEDLHSSFKASPTYGFSVTARANPFERILPSQCKTDWRDWYVFHDNSADYKRRYRNAFSVKLETQLNSLDLLLSYLAEQHIQAIAFNLPITATNKKLLPEKFWTYYHKRISKICEKNNTDYISIDKVVLPFNDDQFIDGVHLNFAGGVNLTKPMAFYIANRFRQMSFKKLLSRSDKLINWSY